MALSINNFEINGVIDTKNTVLNNIEEMARACCCWLTWDGVQGKWAVVINKPGSSIKSFDNSNIIGGINIAGTGLQEMYNAVTIEFPHEDLRGLTDYIDYEVPLANRFPNEQDNTLQIRLDCINNPIQAQYVAVVELKQSRMDKVIQFTTDYSAIGLKAGDLIDITSDVYGFNSKMFRITNLEEDDTGDGLINIRITGIEYDPNVYNDDGLIRKTRTKKTGIVPKGMNQVLTQNDNDSTNKKIVHPEGGTGTGVGGANVPWRKYYYTGMYDIIGDRTWRFVGSGVNVQFPYSGKYSIRIFCNWGCVVRSVYPPLGVCRATVLAYKQNDTWYPVEVLADHGSHIAGTGGDWTPIFDDHTVEYTFTVDEGMSFEPGIAYFSDWKDGVYQVPSGYPSFTTALNDHPVLGMVVDIQLLEPILHGANYSTTYTLSATPT